MRILLNLKTALIGMLAIIIIFIQGCSDESKPGGIFGVIHSIRFTDNPDYSEMRPETIITDAEAQIITLEVKSVTKPDMDLPNSFNFSITEWNEDTDSWDEGTFPGDANQEDDFYHVWIDKEDGNPVIKVSLKENMSIKERKLNLFITSDVRYHNKMAVGIVDIIQSGINPEESGSQKNEGITAGMTRNSIMATKSAKNTE